MAVTNICLECCWSYLSLYPHTDTYHYVVVTNDYIKLLESGALVIDVCSGILCFLQTIEETIRQ